MLAFDVVEIRVVDKTLNRQIRVAFQRLIARGPGLLCPAEHRKTRCPLHPGGPGVEAKLAASLSWQTFKRQNAASTRQRS
jgi:hypothetical protein